MHNIMEGFFGSGCLYKELNDLLKALESKKEEFNKDGYNEMQRRITPEYVESMKSQWSSSNPQDELKTIIETIGRINFLIDLLKNLAKYNKLNQSQEYFKTSHYKKNQDAIAYIISHVGDLESLTPEKIKTIVDKITANEAPAIAKLKESYNIKKYIFGALRALSIILMLSSIPVLFTGSFSGAFVMLLIGLALNKLAISQYSSNKTNIKELEDKTVLQLKEDNISSQLNSWAVSNNTKAQVAELTSSIASFGK